MLLWKSLMTDCLPLLLSHCCLSAVLPSQNALQLGDLDNPLLDSESRASSQSSGITNWASTSNQPSAADTGCHNLKQNLSVSCWDELEVSGYLDQWWQQNKDRCAAGETGFSSCYQQSIGIEQQACDTTGPSHCDFPLNFAAEGYDPQEAYALYTIFGIWQWFQSIYDAVLNADVTAAGPIGAIVRLINPIKKDKKLLGDFLAALTAIAPTIAFPATWGAWGIFKTSTMLEAVVRQSPGVVRELNPVGTLDSEFTDLTMISEDLSVVKSTYQENVSTALKMVQDDYRAFNAFSQHGAFIAPKSNLQAQTENLTRSLQTYTISQAFTESNVVIVMARETNPLALATNGSLGNPELMNCTAYDEYGLCGEWWWDPSTNIAYSVSNIGDPAKSYAEVLRTLFSQGWTSGRDFFAGAKDCADYVAVKQGNNTPTLDTTTMAPRCISNTQICVFKADCEINDQGCIYTGEYGSADDLCGPPQSFLTKGCDGNGDGTFMTFNVPAAYLGPLSYDAIPSHITCIG